MKIRQGFVSNSSTTSFSIYGAFLNIDLLAKLIKISAEENKDITQKDLEFVEKIASIGEDAEDMDWNAVEGFIHTLEKILKGSKIGHWYSYEDFDGVYIGREWCGIGEDETGAQFKKGVRDELKARLSLDDKVKFSTINTEISN